MKQIIPADDYGILQINRHGQISYFNHTISKILGYSFDELNGKRLREVLHQNDAWKEEALIRDTNTSGDDGLAVLCGELGFITRNGQIVKACVTASPVISETGEVSNIIILMRNPEMENDSPGDLSDPGKMMEILLSTLPGMVYRCANNSNWTMYFVSDGCYELTGYYPSDLLYDARVAYADLILPEHRNYVYEEIQKALSQRNHFQLIYKIKTAVGEEKWVREKGCGVWGEDGKLKWLEGFIEDITEWKRAEEELELLYSLLRHDILNKLSVIRGYIELMEDLPLTGEAKKYTTSIDNITRDCASLFQKVHILKEVDKEVVVQKVDLSKVLDEVLSSYKQAALDKEMVLDCEIEDAMAMAGPLISTVFSNIIENSIKHSGGKRILVECYGSDDQIICTIEDDGKGIPDDFKSSIFEKGYRMGKSAGSGLGMYLARRILRSYGGDIEVADSELGGAKFIVRLRRAVD